MGDFIVGHVAEDERRHAQADGRRRGHGHAERDTETPARLDGGSGRGAPGTRHPRHRDRQRGSLQNPRPHLAIPFLLEIHTQRERADGIAVHAEGRQPVQPVEQAFGQRRELIVVQRQARQRIQPVEDVRGQRRKLIAVQRQARQRIQPVEDVRGQRRKLIAVQLQARQRIQPVEIAALQGGNHPAAHIQREYAVQVCRGDLPAIIHAGRRDHSGCHRRRAGTDRCPHRKAEHNGTGLIAVAIHGNPGIRTRHGREQWRAGQCPGRQGQPGGQGRGETVAHLAVASDGNRQGHGRNGVPGDIHLRRHRRLIERRYGIGPHRHDKGQARRIRLRHILVGIFHMPGQRDGRRRGCRSPGQDTCGGIEGQPVGQRAGDGIDRGAVGHDGRRQRQGRNGEPHIVGLRRHRRQDKQWGGVGLVVDDRDRDRPACRDRAIAADCMADGGAVGLVVAILSCGDGDGLRTVPVRGREGQGTGDGHVAAAARGHRCENRGAGVQPHGIGGHPAFGQRDGVRRQQHPGPVPGDAQLEPGVDPHLVAGRLNVGESGVTQHNGRR